MPETVRTIKATNYDELREKIPTSGIFDMTDCKVQIWCPEDSDVDEVDRMVRLIESMVHIDDVQIGSRIEDLTSSSYSVIITEVRNDIRKKYSR